MYITVRGQFTDNRTTVRAAYSLVESELQGHRFSTGNLPDQMPAQTRNLRGGFSAQHVHAGELSPMET